MIQKSNEENNDSWYKRMSEKPKVKPEDEAMVGLMEWVYLMSKIPSK